MKKIFLIAIILFLSCSKEDQVPLVLLTTANYPTNSNDKSSLSVYVGSTRLGQFIEKENTTYTFMSDTGFFSEVKFQDNGKNLLGSEWFGQQIYYESSDCSGNSYVDSSMSGLVGFYTEGKYIYDYQPILIMVNQDSKQIHVSSYYEWGYCWQIDKTKYVSAFDYNDGPTTSIPPYVTNDTIEVVAL